VETTFGCWKVRSEDLFGPRSAELPSKRMERLKRELGDLEKELRELEKEEIPTQIKED